MNRRDFLKGMAAGAAGVTLAGASAAGLTALGVPGAVRREVEWARWLAEMAGAGPMAVLRSSRALTFEGALEFARKLDTYRDAIVPLMPAFAHNEYSLRLLGIEAIPYFSYENISGPIWYASGEMVDAEPMYPNDIMWAHFERHQNFHVAGKAFCQATDRRWVWMNLKFGNQFSPWYTRASMVTTLIHELAHVNQCSCDIEHELLESTTVLATLEVMAAMVRHRNPYILPPLVMELQGLGLDFAWYLSMKYGREAEFAEALFGLANHAFWRASFQKALDVWRPRREELQRILREYGRVPYMLLIEALKDPDLETRQLPLPSWHKKIVMDDTAYVLAHIDELCADYPKLVAERVT